MKHFFADADLGLIGLLFFFAFFCVTVLWTFRPGGKKTYVEHGDIPLKEKDDE
ncbi:MAG: cbb3-type cytochrome c oxidase subunit 3 [Alphaproteobacteria bacterium]|nr:cbb3-type cytochrome c oxidase subunit 3 [Alphaproteobacteria bacterium]